MKKAITLLANDIHLNKDNGELVKDIFNQIIEICEKYNISDILCGGDIFTNRSGQPLSCLTDWKEILKKLGSNGITLHAIPGNHDKTDKDDKKSYLDVYGSKYFKVYRKAGVVELGGIDFVMMPYFGDEKWLEEYNNLIKKYEFENKVRILITHSGFDGVMNNDGSKVESIIKPSMFKEFNKVLIGHYHNASKLAENIYYTGSVYQNDFGETITDKGVTIIYSDGTIKNVQLKFPQYIKEIIDVNDTETLRNLLERYEGDEYNHIRFIFRGDKVDASKVDIPELSKKGIEARFEANETEEAIQVSESEAVLCYDKKAIIQDFTKFCAENSIKGKYLKYGLNLIKSL